jgi:hypothetical protein
MAAWMVVKSPNAGFLSTTSEYDGKARASACWNVLCRRPPMYRTHSMNCRSIISARVAFAGNGAAAAPRPGRSPRECPATPHGGARSATAATAMQAKNRARGVAIAVPRRRRRRRCHGRLGRRGERGSWKGRRGRFGEWGGRKPWGENLWKGGDTIDHGQEENRKGMEEWRKSSKVTTGSRAGSCEVRLVSRCGLWRVAPRTAQAQGVRAMHVFVAVPRGVLALASRSRTESPAFQVRCWRLLRAGRGHENCLLAPLTGIFLEGADKVLFWIWCMFVSS